MNVLRVGLIGARRARQGLGPFVARDLRAAGAEVPCFLVSRPESLAEAESQLAEAAGVRARGYVDLAALLARERLDALAICTPHEAHRTALEAGLAAGLHALCEKPLLWGEPALASGAGAVVGAFAERRLLLWENCQWPYTLPAFERLHPEARGATPRRFAMRLQPAGGGARMLADSLPHPLSLLQRLAPAPDPRVEEVRFRVRDAEVPTTEVAFLYRAGDAAVETCVELRPTTVHPRKVELELDGRRARRVAAPPDYRLSFADGERSVPLQDPMPLLIRDFVGAARRGGEAQTASRGREIVARIAMLEQIVGAWERAAG